MSAQPRLAFVIPRLVCGGVEMFLLRLCPHLRARGFDVEIVTTEEPGAWFDRVASEVKTVHIDGAAQFPRCWHPLRVGRYLAQGGYDMVFLNGDRLAQESLTMLPDRVVAAPIIHSDRVTAYRIACANSEAWNVAVAIGPKLLQTARESLPQRPIVSIMHGVELPEEDAFLHRVAMTGDELRVIYVGRLIQSVKNVMVLPEIIRRCRSGGVNARLTIVGDGPDRAALESLVEGFSLADCVEFAGEVPPTDVYRLFLAHHVAVLPSFYEGLGLVLAEGQACGCVPVASLLPGVTTPVVKTGRTGWLVRVNDVEGFVAALKRLHADPPGWAAMSAAGHARASRFFSLERMVDRYVTLIEDALVGKYPLPRSRRGRLPVDPALYWRECVPPWAKAAGRRVLRRGAAAG